MGVSNNKERLSAVSNTKICEIQQITAGQILTCTTLPRVPWFSPVSAYADFSDFRKSRGCRVAEIGCVHTTPDATNRSGAGPAMVSKKLKKKFAASDFSSTEIEVTCRDGQQIFKTGFGAFFVI